MKSVLLWFIAALLLTVDSFRLSRQYNARNILNNSKCRLSAAAMDDSIIPPLDRERPLRVLLCVEPTPFNYISGYANRFKETLKHLKQAGDEVHVITPDNDPRAPSAFAGFPITNIPGGPFPLYNLVTVSMDLRTAAIPRTIATFKPDIVHVSAPSLLLFPAVFWAKTLKVPLVMSYHTDLVSYAKTYLKIPGGESMMRMLVKTCVNQADLALCTSPQLQKELVDLGIKRVDVWRKGINTEVFAPRYKDDTMRHFLSNGCPDRPLLLYVGRLGEEKKIHRLKKVLDANPTARLAVVGHGPAEESLKSSFSGYPVVFAGKLEGIELSKAYASADLFVMPSDSETLGFVVMEALASGLPVVGVEAGGLPDIIQSNATGFLAENNDNMEDFSQKVKLLIEDRESYNRFASQAVKWAQHWDWQSATSVLRNVQYRKAIELFNK